MFVSSNLGCDTQRSHLILHEQNVVIWKKKLIKLEKYSFRIQHFNNILQDVAWSSETNTSIINTLRSENKSRSDKTERKETFLYNLP